MTLNYLTDCINQETIIIDRLTVKMNIPNFVAHSLIIVCIKYSSIMMSDWMDSFFLISEPITFSSFFIETLCHVPSQELLVWCWACCKNADWVTGVRFVAGVPFLSESLCCISPVFWTNMFTSWPSAAGLFWIAKQYLAGQKGNVHCTLLCADFFLLQGALTCWYLNERVQNVFFVSLKRSYTWFLRLF